MRSATPPERRIRCRATLSVIVLSLYCPPTGADADDSREIMEIESYRRTFEEYLGYYQGFPGDVLVSELEDQIRSLLARGGGVGPSDRTPEVVATRRRISATLTARVCAEPASARSPDHIERAGMESVRAAMSRARPSPAVLPADFGQINAVLVRLVDLADRRLCESEDLRDLFPEP